MNRTLCVSGFGYAKALIFGEYAVMYGAVGLAVALDVKLRIDMSQISWGEDSHEKNLGAIDDVEGLVRAVLLPKISAQIAIDDRFFFDSDDNKYGIGSSAASVVAAVQAHLRAVRALNDGDRSVPSLQEWGIRRAIEAHRAIQNGLGSGIDVAASALGGVILARNCHRQIEIERIPAVHLPPMGIFTMHRRAPTLPYIQAAERMKSMAEAQAILRDMHDLYEEMGNEVRQKRHEAFLETIPAHLALLRAWEKCLGMPILPTEFECIERLAHECGAVIKTAGAGGGDLLVAFARDKANIRELVKKLNALSISEIPFGIAPERDYP